MPDRIDEIINKMTLEEKVSMLTGADMWHTQSIDRLGIGAIRVCDGPYGVRVPLDENAALSHPSTCFPTGAWMGATWNVELIEKVGQALGDETKAKGSHILLGPCINIHRSPLAGRNFESFSEDPFHAAKMSVAFVSGVQSQNVGASVKHFALNNSEFERFTISSEADMRTIREIYLPAFEATVKETQPWTVMNSYNKINGTWASENRWLLTDVLKNEWGFEGVVVSDWFANGSTKGSAENGLDLEMPGPARLYGSALLEAVKSGEVDEAILTDKLRRILTIVKKAGRLEAKEPRASVAVRFPDYSRLALETAAQAMVLLKNDNSVLPFDPHKIKTLAVIGPNAARPHFNGGGSSRVKPAYVISPLQALEKELEGKM